MPLLPWNTLAQLRLRFDSLRHDLRIRQDSHACALEAVALEERVLYSVSPLPIAPDADSSLDFQVEQADTILFIDEQVEDKDGLLRSLDVDSTSMTVVVLERNRDGIAQITEALAGRTNIQSIHLLSHGNSEQLNLGATTLTSENLAGYAGEIAAWKNVLSDRADLFIYGCNLGATESGRQIVAGLGALCDCDVAASDDVTGASDWGGDWELEYEHGNVDASASLYAPTDTWSHSLAMFTVTSTLDDGSVGTLRWAINQANASAGTDQINFNISDADPGHLYYRDDGIANSLTNVATTTLVDAAITDFDPDYPFAQYSWFRIDLDIALPELVVTEAVEIDGYSQTGASENTLAVGHNGNLRIELTQTEAGTGNTGIHFAAGSDNSVVEGLSINRFESMGILASANNITIRGNFIGTDITGTADLGNTDAGVQLRSDDNTIGGSNVSDRNVISGNDARGIALFSFSIIQDNTVENNYIGVDATGLGALGNDMYGLQLFNSDATRVVNNVISGNDTDGIRARDTAATTSVSNSVIQGNFVGVAADGSTPIANGENGIRLESDTVTGITIGGAAAGEGNVISGNVEHGILLDGAVVTGNNIWGNFIGTDQTASLDLGNGGSGIFTHRSAANNSIGGVDPGEGNVIAYNADDGVSLSTLGTGQGYANSIRRNRIFANGDLGIDLGDDDQTPNDNNYGGGSADLDDGPNRMQNFPNMVSARLVNGDLVIQFEATTFQNETLDIDFYVSTAANPSGYGGAERFLDSVVVNTNSDGKEGFLSHTIAAAPVVLGEFITATTSHSDGSTSEFSLALPVLDASRTLLFATRGATTNAGVPGIGEWQEDQVLEFGGPSISNGSITLGEDTTDGTLSQFFDLERFTSGATSKLNAIHYVESNLTIGSGGQTFDLQVGDILFAVDDANKTFSGTTTSITVNQEDVAVYRPDATLGYTTGEFYHLLDNPSGNDINALALVEEVGGITLADGSNLAQGTFLLTGGGGDRDIEAFTVTSVGTGTTAATGSLFVDGSAPGIGIGNEVQGLSIVGTDVVIGGINLLQGDLLITLQNGDSNVGTGGLNTNDTDAFILRLADTDLTPGRASGTAIMLFDGDDVGLTTGNEDLNALSMQILSSPPTDIDLSNNQVAETIDTSGGFSVGTLTATDPDPFETFTYSIVPGDDGANFNIGGGGSDELILDDGVLDRETKANYVVTVRVTDSTGSSYSEQFTIIITNVNEPPIVQNPIGPINVQEDAADSTFVLNNVFQDPDGPSLTFSVSNSNAGIVTASVAADTLTFDYLDDQHGTATIDIEATDGEFFVQETILLTVTPVNDAPILLGVQDLADVGQDATDPPGALISSLLAGMVTDIDAGSSVAGVAIIGNGANISEGTWEYSTDGGTNWQAVSTVSDTSALVLSATASLRFLPAAGYVGSPGDLDLRVIDDSYAGLFTTSSARVSIDTTPRGGITPISSGAAAINTNVTSHGIVVSPTAGLTTTEAGGQATFSVVLLSMPTGAVTVPIVSSDSTEGNTSTSLLSFDNTNWNVAQTVTITGANDDIADGDIGYTVQLGMSASSDPTYAGIDVADVSVSNLDDDTVGTVVTPTLGLVTTESGGQASFDVVLTSQPTAVVTITASSNQPTEGTPSTNLLTFDATNWNIPQTVTITGQDDSIVDGNVTYGITLGDTSSTDTQYQGLVVADVAATNIDDDNANVVVTPTTGLATTENGGQASFSVVLTSQPTAIASISVASDTPSEGITSTNLLSFDATNWNVAQIVSITGIDDSVVDGSIAYNVLLGTSSSLDTNYDGIDVADVSVTNIDDDNASVLVSPTGGLVTTETGGQDSFAVVLTSEPTAQVTITASSSAPTEGNVSNALTFDSSNWNVPQAFTVTGIDDVSMDGDQAYMIALNTSSLDPNYAAIVPSSVSVSNTDDDAAQIQVTPTVGLTTSESGTQATFEVVLSSAPTANVRIAVATSDPNEGTLSTTILDFDALNWDIRQTVTVTGVDDIADDGDVAYTIVLGAAVSVDPNFDAIDPSDVAIINLDNDSAGISVSQTSITSTSDEEQATFEVVLTSQPTAPVTISVASDAPTIGIAAPGVLTFLPTDWNVPQMVTVTSLVNESGTNSFQIILSPAVSADPTYNSLDPPNVSATISRLISVIPSEEPPTTSEEEAERDDVPVVPATIATSETVPTPPTRSNLPGRISGPEEAIVPAELTTTFEPQKEQPRVPVFNVPNKPPLRTTQTAPALEFTETANRLPSAVDRAMDEVKNQIQTEIGATNFKFGSVTFATSAFSVGYITWLVRGGQLLMSVLAQLPAWQFLDPLPILAQLEEDDEASEDESLESMVSDPESERSNEHLDHSSEAVSR